MNKFNQSIYELLGSTTHPTENRSELLVKLHNYIMACYKMDLVKGSIERLKQGLSMENENVDTVFIDFKENGMCFISFTTKDSEERFNYYDDPFGEQSFDEFSKECLEEISSNFTIKFNELDTIIDKVLTPVEKSTFEDIEFFEKQTLESQLAVSNIKKPTNKV